MTTARQNLEHRLESGWAEDSPVLILQDLEEERGKLFTEAEYQEMRRTVLQELAHGARIRPFTIFTFAVVALGLLAMLVLGIQTANGTTLKDLALAIVSGVALIAAVYFFWSCLDGIKRDALRSLDERLGELEQLNKLGLINPDEYQHILSHILIARQRSAGGAHQALRQDLQGNP